MSINNQIVAPRMFNKKIINYKSYLDESYVARLKLSELKRKNDCRPVDEVVSCCTKRNEIRFKIIDLQKEHNGLSRSIGIAKKEKRIIDVDGIKEQVNDIKKNIEEIEKDLEKIEDLLQTICSGFGNIVHDSVPVSSDEENNELIKTWESTNLLDMVNPRLIHNVLFSKIAGYNPVVGCRVAGHRGYYLMNVGLWLNQALVNYGISFLRKKGYETVQTPFFMKTELMHKVAQLSEFDEALYKVDDDCVLIATAEQPLCALHEDQYLASSQLPIKYGGYSTCFRKEAGSSGKDVLGLFRVHQFEKVEQFVLCDPSKSEEMHEELMRVTEEFYQSLGIPYRIVSIVSGALNNAAVKKYDLEAWFPGSGCYRELVSNSNCTDYQSRQLKIRFGVKTVENKQTEYVHLLNCTLVATERTMCAVLENYQTDAGIRIPEVLQPFLAPYLDNPSFVPFIN